MVLRNGSFEGELQKSIPWFYGCLIGQWTPPSGPSFDYYNRRKCYKMLCNYVLGISRRRLLQQVRHRSILFDLFRFCQCGTSLSLFEFFPSLCCSPSMSVLWLLMSTVHSHVWGTLVFMLHILELIQFSSPAPTHKVDREQMLKSSFQSIIKN